MPSRPFANTGGGAIFLSKISDHVLPLRGTPLIFVPIGKTDIHAAFELALTHQVNRNE